MLLGDDAAIRSGQHGVVSAEQIALLAPKTNKIHINSEPAAVWRSREKKKVPQFLRCGLFGQSPNDQASLTSHIFALFVFTRLGHA